MPDEEGAPQSKFRKTDYSLFHPRYIGQIVKIQVFQIDKNGNLDHNTFEKHVGVLRTYGFDPNNFWFALDGGTPRAVSKIGYLVEIYPMDGYIGEKVEVDGSAIAP